MSFQRIIIESNGTKKRQENNEKSKTNITNHQIPVLHCMTCEDSPVLHDIHYKELEKVQFVHEGQVVLININK